MAIPTKNIFKLYHVSARNM